MSALDAAKRADQLKDDANRSLHEDRPQEALSLYTKAIGIQPSAVLYANRAAAQMRIGRLQKAIDDANEALKLDKTYAKAYYRKARALTDDKQYDAADRCLDEAFQNLPPNDDYRREKEREALEKLRDLVEQKRDEARGAPTAKHFEFLGELGTGNYSSVYEVARKSDGSKFALKLVEKAQVDKIKRRHPNVHNEVKMEKVRRRRPATLLRRYAVDARRLRLTPFSRRPPSSACPRTRTRTLFSYTRPSRTTLPYISFWNCAPAARCGRARSMRTGRRPAYPHPTP